MNPLSGWPLWATIPIWIIISLILLTYGLLPAILTRMTGARGTPRSKSVGLAGLCEPVRNAVNEQSKTLESLGYTFADGVVIDGFLTGTAVHLGIFLHNNEQAMAIAQGLTVGTDPDADPLDVTDHTPPHKANNATDNSKDNKNNKDNKELPHHLPTAAARFAGWTFASESTDNTDILTTGTTIPEHVFGEQGRSILQLRGEENLSKLANFHNAHTETVAAGRLKPTPVKSMLTRTAAKDVEKVLDMQSRAGAWKRRDDAYTLTFWGAYVLAWTHLPPMSWLYWLKMRRFAKMLATQRPELRV